jgi:hypothetical protein
MKSTTGERLERVNVMLSRQDSSFLDQLSEEIHTSTGARISRSEIVRAGIAGMRELHRLAPECRSRFMPLTSCQRGADLVVWMVLAIRWACQSDGTTHLAGNMDRNGATTHQIQAEGV